MGSSCAVLWAGVDANNWATVGQPKLTETLSTFLSGEKDQKALSAALYISAQLVAKGELEPIVLVDSLEKAGLGLDNMEAAREVCMDVLSLLELESEASNQRCVEDLSRQLMVRKILPMEPSLRILDVNLLGPLMIEGSDSKANRPTVAYDYGKAVLRARTVLQYKQNKYNLLREQSEGYAKLTVLLSQESSGGDIQGTVNAIVALIGHFELDPIRVMDITMDLAEAKLSELGSRDESKMEVQQHILRHSQKRLAFYVGILQEMKPRKGAVTRLLQFKLIHLQAAGSPIPQAFFRVAAALIGVKLVDLTDLLKHLQPSITEMIAGDKAMREDAAATASRIQRVGQMRKDVEDKRSIEEYKRDIKEEYEIRLRAQEEALGHNQKVQLGLALLEQNNWMAAKELLARMPQWTLVAYPPCARGLCGLLHAVIEPVYRALLKDRPSVPADIVTRLGDLRELDSSKGVVVAERLPDLIECAMDMAQELGAYMSVDPVLMAKMARLGREMVRDPALRPCYVDVVSGTLLPSLVLLRCNPNMVEEIWESIRVLPWLNRFELYSVWKNYAYEEPNAKKEGTVWTTAVNAAALVHPLLPVERAMACFITSNSFKRFTSEDVRVHARFLGKLTHSNPGVVFDYLCHMISNFDNWIQTVVDSFRLLTNMAKDVFIFCLSEALPRFKDGMLKNLAQLAGAFYRRYPSVQATGLLSHVCINVRAGRLDELVVLREMVRMMAGVDVSEEVSDVTLKSMGGSRLLRYLVSHVSSNQNLDKSIARLQEELAPMAVPALITLSQKKNSVVFEGNAFDAKDVGTCSKTYDECHAAFIQLAEFLQLHVNHEVYSTMVPDVLTLLEDYGLQEDSAFHLNRPIYARKIKERGLVLSAGATTPTKKNEAYIQATDEVMGPLAAAMVTRHPDGWNLMTPKLFTTFWSLSMYDLHYPKERYEAAIKELKANIENPPQEQAEGGRKHRGNDAWKTKLETLTAEMAEHEEHTKRVLAALRKESSEWFHPDVEAKGLDQEAITVFIERCIAPRRVFSALDAAYSAEFVRLMHKLNTKGFSTLSFYAQTLTNMRPYLISSTEYEAKRYGRFINIILQTANHWAKKEAAYTMECLPLWGGQFPNKKEAAEQSRSKLTHTEYLRIFRSWHNKILFPHVCACLESKKPNQMRNTLWVLKEMADSFPVAESCAVSLDEKILAIGQDVPELSATANSLLPHLRKYRNVPGRYFIMVGVDWQMGEADPNTFRAQSTNESKPTNTPRRSSSKEGSTTPAVANSEPDGNARPDDRPSPRSEPSRSTSRAANSNRVASRVEGDMGGGPRGEGSRPPSRSDLEIPTTGRSEDKVDNISRYSRSSSGLPTSNAGRGDMALHSDGRTRRGPISPHHISPNRDRDRSRSPYYHPEGPAVKNESRDNYRESLGSVRGGGREGEDDDEDTGEKASRKIAGAEGESDRDGKRRKVDRESKGDGRPDLKEYREGRDRDDKRPKRKERGSDDKDEGSRDSKRKRDEESVHIGEGEARGVHRITNEDDKRAPREKIRINRNSVPNVAPSPRDREGKEVEREPRGERVDDRRDRPKEIKRDERRERQSSRPRGNRH